VLLLCLPLSAWRQGFAQAPPSPPTTPITLQQAVEQALAHNPALLAAQQNLLSMKGQEVEAGLRQNPDFSVYGSDLSTKAALAHG
jgi:cobalt-zinc-cadmium efflux system outer membrane protein